MNVAVFYMPMAVSPLIGECGLALTVAAGAIFMVVQMEVAELKRLAAAFLVAMFLAVGVVSASELVYCPWCGICSSIEPWTPLWNFLDCYRILYGNPQ